VSEAGAGDARRLATEARDRVRFEEEALGLADQVYRVARRLVGTREEAEELVQETYARAFRSWRSYSHGTNMRAWLLRILTNLNLDRGRRIQRTPDTQPLEEGDYYLANKVSALPHDFRDVVVLVDIGDFSYADAAQILDVPLGTVMSRLHRGRRLLKQKLAEETLA
jgi:RNA polymerase sigma-70 factor (ECF subfamily)